MTRATKFFMITFSFIESGQPNNFVDFRALCHIWLCGDCVTFRLYNKLHTAFNKKKNVLIHIFSIIYIVLK
jgi:hypothetical protein